MDYDTAQICRNGHVITANVNLNGGRHLQRFCAGCGAETILACACGATIRGQLWLSSRVQEQPPYQIPAYCANCGAPYPWTQTALEEAAKFAAEARLDIGQREFADIIENLVKDSPRTIAAASRYQQIITKAGPMIADGFKAILINVVTETAKRILFPPAA